MQNPSTGTKGTTKQLHNVADTMRDTVEQATSDVASKASRIASDTSEVASEYYSQATNWLSQNYGKTLGFVGFLGAAGLIGYFIGKNRSNSTYSARS